MVTDQPIGSRLGQNSHSSLAALESNRVQNQCAVAIASSARSQKTWGDRTLESDATPLTESSESVMSASLLRFAFHGHAKAPALAVTPKRVGIGGETYTVMDRQRLRPKPMWPAHLSSQTKMRCAIGGRGSMGANEIGQAAVRQTPRRRAGHKSPTAHAHDRPGARQQKNRPEAALECWKIWLRGLDLNLRPFRL